MKKQYSLKSNIKFNRVLSKGKKIKSNSFLISYIKGSEFKIGISVPKKLGNAVFRNHNKRVIKNIIPKLNVYDKNVHVVLVVKESFINLSIDDKTRILEKELNKINT